MSKLSKKIIGKIKKQEIKPTPKWHFLLKRNFIWSFFILSIFLGSFAFGFILLQLNNTDWEIYHLVQSGFILFLIIVLPYFWLFIMVTFLWIAYLNFKHTETGYRHNFFFIVAISLSFSLLGGGILYATGLNNYMENKLLRLPSYQKIQDQRQRFWNQPEKGLLVGEILKKENSHILIFNDLQNKIWKVDITDAKNYFNVPLEQGSKIKLIGTQTGQLTFKTTAIRPISLGKIRKQIRQKIHSRNLPNLFERKK